RGECAVRLVATVGDEVTVVSRKPARGDPKSPALWRQINLRLVQGSPANVAVALAGWIPSAISARRRIRAPSRTSRRYARGGARRGRCVGPRVSVAAPAGGDQGQRAADYSGDRLRG